MTYLNSIIGGILDVVYPRICLACRRRRAHENTGYTVCAACARSIAFSMPPFCHGCGRQLEKPYLHKTHCRLCRRRRPAFDRAFSPCAYNGVIRTLIHEFKYRGKNYLGGYLSSFMVNFITYYGLPMDDMDYIIPVPLHPARLREREFNQAQVLAQAVADAFNRPLGTDMLARRHRTRIQAKLAPAARLENVRESFSAGNKPVPCNSRIMLIDDVLTSGATASAAARTLKDAGAATVFVMTLAH